MEQLSGFMLKPVHSVQLTVITGSAVVVESSESVMLAQCWDNHIPSTMASELQCRQKLKYLMLSKEVIKAAFKRRTQVM